jgi:TetR/AcrR family transcriptional repressor of nem operon
LTRPGSRSICRPAEFNGALGVRDVVQSFTAALAKRLATDPPKRKGERTRERFKLATAQVLEEFGFHAMRVSDISDAAEASEGTFYIYFRDKRDATRTVLQEFLSGIQTGGDGDALARGSAFDAIRHTNLQWIRLVRANAGLMRCAFQLGDEDAEFGRLVHSYNRIWYERVAKSVVRHRPQGAISMNAALFAAYSLGAMMDDLMRRMVVYPDQDFLAFLRKVAPTDEAIADALSVIWIRVLYPNEDLPKMSRLAAELAAPTA